MEINIIIQARTSSSRFPQKIIEKIGDLTMLELLIYRVKKAKLTNRIIVATSTDQSDDIVEEIVSKLNVDFFRGSLVDVLDRYYNASIKFDSDVIIRITGDCPLIDPELIDNLVKRFNSQNIDYLSNTLEPTYPDGQDIEIFSFNALENAWNNARLKSEREHVTPYIYNNSSFKGKSFFSVENFKNPNGDFSNIRMTVDYQRDFDVIKSLVEFAGTDAKWETYVKILNDKKLYEYNNIYNRNEGYYKSLKND